MKSSKNNQSMKKQVLGHHHSLASIQKPLAGSTLASYDSTIPVRAGVKGVLMAARHQVNDSQLSQ